MTAIGTQIKNRRKLLKVTQRQLAELSGVGINTLTKIERNEANPTLEILEKILDTLGLELTVSVKSMNDDIDEDVKGYVEYSLKVCEKPRRNFHENYLYNLDENLNVLSSKENYSYHDFYRKPDPCAPLSKDLFKRNNKNQN